MAAWDKMVFYTPVAARVGSLEPIAVLIPVEVEA
jgi:hypothetical protein